MILTLGEIITVTGGRLIAGSAEGFVRGAIIDSREAKGGELFFPLPGEKENGHRYIADALARGAAASLLEKSRLHLFDIDSIPPGKALIVVEDCLRCLQQIAAYYRGKFDLPVVAVTGSNGKTTTKDFIASVLSTRCRVLKTEGNFNNEIGLPLTLLRLQPQHELAVLELGMRALGEIALLSSLCKPCVGVITNIGEAHLELLGSRENISRAKGELLEVMGPDGTAVLNGDDPYLRRMGASFAGKTLYFGYGEASDLRVSHSYPDKEGCSFTAILPGGDTEAFWIPLPGKHNAYNALAAVALGLHFSLNTAEIKEGLAAAVFSAMRMERIQARSGFCIINDAYNASPTSMQYALQALREGAGSALTVAVLGDMFELGAYAEEGHRRTGQWVADTGIDYLVTVGKQAVLIGEGALAAGMSPGRVWHCSEHAEALNVLHSLSLSGTHILIKGSRRMSMERIVDGLLLAYNQNGEGGTVK